MLVKSKLRSLVVKGVSGTPLEGPLRQAYMRLMQPRAYRYDRQKTAVMQRVLRFDSNCIDVGAYRGEVLREIVALAPRGHHFAFEPIPENVSHLRQRFDSVTIHEVALSDAPGTSVFQHVRSRPARSGLRLVDYPEAEEVDELTVRTETLDNIIPTDVPIALLKLDVEGGEHAVLRGARETILASRPIVLFEHDPARSQTYGAGSEAIFDLVNDELDLRISTMARWLAGQEPLSRDEFIERANDFEYIAYPGKAAA
jgi:FkbM family methyltransferase